MQTEEPLPGGHVTPVVRIGDTVRRPPPARAAFVRRLLDHLQACGWAGAPRHLGVDDRGREVLSYLDGHVAWAAAQPAAVGSPASLARVATLLRELHDLTAGTALTGDDEVVCHNDLAPRNTVYREHGGQLRPVAFIDWDIAAPGRRIHDVAHVCWQYVHLGQSIVDVSDAAARVRMIADAYGLSDRGELVDTILWWQDRCWRGIEAAALAGHPAMLRLHESGVTHQIRDDREWTVTHRPAFDRALA